MVSTEINYPLLELEKALKATPVGSFFLSFLRVDKQKSEEDQRLISVTQDLGVTVRTRAHFLYSKLGIFHVPPKGAICSTIKIEWEGTVLESWQVHCSQGSPPAEL